MASIDRVMALAEELKKKKKDSNYEVSQSTINTLDLAREIQSGNKTALKDYVSNNRSVFDAPIKKLANDDDKNFLQKIIKGSEAFDDNKNLFKDGYDFGDITKTAAELVKDTAITAGSTAGDIALNIIKAPISIGTSLGKGIGAVGAQIADWTGNDEYAQKVRNRIAGKEENAFGSFGNPMENVVNEGIEKLDATSISGDTGDAIANAVGYQLTFAGAGKLLGNAGNINLGSLQVPILAVAAGFGEGMGEAYSKEDVEDWQAWLKGAGTGAVSGITEGLFGMFGVGGSALDDFLVKSATKKVESALAKAAVKTGVKALGESTEELLEYTGNYVLDHGIDLLTQITGSNDVKFGQVWNNEEVLEQMFTAAMSTIITSGAGTAINVKSNADEVIQAQEQALGRSLTDAEKATIKKSIAKDTVEREINKGYSNNEQTIIDAEFQNRLEEKEKDGNKLSKKQKEQLREEVKEDLQKGYISTDTIESTLGGDTFNSLKSLRDNKTNLETQIKELENKPNAEITVKEMEQLNDLRERFKAVDTNTLETQLQSEIGQKIKSDGYLQRSYQEKAKRSQEFTYEAAETDSEFRRGVMESTKGKLNDTTRSHETAEALVKLSEDRQMQYKFTNNAELKDMGLVQEGKTANGLYVVDKDGSREILVNTDSKKYIEAVLVHETAHDFQTTSPETYTKLQDITREFAEAQNEYSRIYSEVAGMYKNVKDANIDEEVTSRLLEDYLGNKDFINSLTTKEPNIVKKIIEEIKYLVKKFTAGSPEARKLVELQHNLEKTYREAYRQTEVTDAKEGTKYSVSEDSEGRKLSEQQTEFFKDSKVRDSEGNLLTMYHGTNNDFTMFDKSFIGKNTNNEGIFGKGFYFTEKKSLADNYNRKEGKVAKDGSGKTMELYLDMKNPFYWNDIDTKEKMEAFIEETGMPKYVLRWNNTLKNQMAPITDIKAERKFSEILQKNGYDGVIYKYDDGVGEYVVFNSNQIKDVTNLNPTENPDIRYSLSEERKLYHGTTEGFKLDDNKPIFLADTREGALSYSDDSDNVVEFDVKAGKTLDLKQDDIKSAVFKEIFAEQNNLVNQIPSEFSYISKNIYGENEVNTINPRNNEADFYKWLDIEFNSDQTTKINGLVVDEGSYYFSKENQAKMKQMRDAYLSTGNVSSRDLVYQNWDKIIEYAKSKGYDYIEHTGEPLSRKGDTFTEVIVLNPSEAIKTSLSNENDIAPTSTPNQTAAQDIRLQVEEAIAPLQEEIAALREEINLTSEPIQPDRRVENPVVTDDIDYAPASQEVVEQQNSEAFSTIDESSMPDEVEDIIPETEQLTPTDSLFDTRDYAEVGDRKIKAYQYENPEVRPFFQQAAREMMGDLDASVKGERFTIGDTSQVGNGDYYYSGTTRHTTEDIAELLDGIDGKYKYSYAEIRKGLQAIIEDNGLENNAASKRIEFYLDKRLREGYTDIEGYRWEADEEYLDMLRAKGISDYYSNLPLGEAPIEEASNTEVVEDIAPVRNVSNINDVETTDKGKQQHLNLNNLGETLQDNNVDWDSVENTSLENAKQLTIDGTEEDLVKKTKRELRQALLGTEAQKEFITDALDNAKNRSMAFMNNTDTIRNTELVFGRDAGRMINELIFQKEIDNEADSIKWQNKERDEIKALGIKARSKESAAVQKYGEKQYVTDAGEVIAYGDAELAAEFPDVATQNKIKAAAQAIRSKYDTYIDLANGVLTKLGFDPIKKRNDYMRHFQELNDVFSRWGLPFNAQNMQEHTLPTDINGLTEFWSPKKNYFANMQERKGNKTTYDAITGVDGYIGGIANLIYHTEDIQRGRAFEELIRETYGEDKGFENLDNLPDELKQLRAEKIQNNHLSNYAAWVHEWTNNVAGKKNKIDRSVEAMFGRKGFALLDQTRKQVGANMIGFNLSSSLTNLIAPVQAMAKTNKLAVVKGTADTIKNIFVKDNFMDKNRFLTSRMGTDMISKNAWQKMQDAGFIFMKGMDWFSSNQIVRSKYYELRAKGMSETQAHAEAGQFAARILGDRTKGANAQLYNSKLVGLVTQFQLEVNNQLYSMFYDTYHDSKEVAKGNAARTAAGMTFTLGQLFAFTHLFGKTFESIAGYNPTFDVIGMLMTAFGWGDDEDEEKTTSERLKAAADQLVDSLPYVNILTGGGRIPVASGIPNVVGVMTGGKDEYGNELTWEDELKKLLYLVPPTGGNQVKKTYQGLSMFDEDFPVSGSYTDSGNLRFPVEDTPLNRLQAGLFGQWASENARNYFDNERQPLKEKQIQEYADLDLPIQEYWDYREGLKEQNTTQEKFDYINSLDVSDEQKNIMINNAIDRKDAIDMSNYDDFGGYEEFDYATKNPDKYRVIELIDSFDNYNSYKEDIASIKEQFSTDNGYDTKQRKAAVQQYIQSLNLDIPQKIMLEKMAGGYSIKSYTNYMYGYIESLPLTAEEKQAIHNQLFD